MQRLIKKLVILLLFLFISDRTIGILLDEVMTSQKSGLYADINRVLIERPDVLIIGTSKALRNYIPSIIMEDVNLTCYNLGQDGSNLINAYAMLNHILRTYTPKAIIFDIVGQEFDKDMVNPSRFENMLPFIAQNENAIDLIEEEDKYIRLKMTLKLFPYNGKLIKMVGGLFQDETSRMNMGYAPIYGNNIDEIQKAEKKYNYSEENESEVLRTAFNAILEEIQIKKINLIFINSPQWHHTDGSPKYELSKSLNNIIENNGYKLKTINSRNFQALNDKSLYKDLAHLNHKGAVVFSEVLNQLIKENNIKLN